MDFLTCTLLNHLLICAFTIQAHSFFCPSLNCTPPFFYKWEVCVNAASTKSIGAIFPKVLAPFLSLSHFEESHSISDFFIIISLWWSVSVIFDFTIETVLGLHELFPYQMVNLINKYMCSDCSTDHSSMSLPLLKSIS